MTNPENPVNWFEIPATDLSRAKSFYEHVFEQSLEVHEMGPMKMAWFPMTADGKGATGTLVAGEHYEPSHKGSLVYFSVEDIEKSLARVASKGGKVLNPKMSIGEHGFIAHFEDSEGNRVALHTPA